MTEAVIDGVSAAFVTGLVTGVHCMGMCGPLACAALPRDPAGMLASGLSYHGSRVLAYSLVGTLAGSLGIGPVRWLTGSPMVLLPWAFVIVLFLVAIGWKPKMAGPAIFRNWFARIKIKAMGWKGWQRGLALGLVTPLLPCGPLYLLLIACFMAGSSLKGAEIAAAFALGTIPLLWMAHGSFALLGRRLTPQFWTRLQRSVALLAVIVLVWRLRGTLPFWYSEVPPCCG